jgi:hypothetical protein
MCQWAFELAFTTAAPSLQMPNGAIPARSQCASDHIYPTRASRRTSSSSYRKFQGTEPGPPMGTGDGPGDDSDPPGRSSE